MRSILFYIPAEIAGAPVFGVGLLLAAWLLVAVLGGLWLARRPGGAREAAGFVPLVLIIAAVIVFLLPGMVERDASGRLLGVPIRGFGVMLMLATVAGVGLAARRAWQAGIDPDAIYSLAFVMFVAGIVGARIFYLIEYGHEFICRTPQGGIDLAATVRAMLNVTQGGLVVYGSVLAAVPAGIWFCRRRGLPVLQVGDVIAPGMVLGLAVGRIGCFLNGCCFGGVCPTASYAVSFPPGSPPYVYQQQAGWQSGVWLEEAEGRVKVAYVAPASAAAEAGVAAGQTVAAVNGSPVGSLSEARARVAEGGPAYELRTAEGQTLRWVAVAAPARSVPIHPAQLYAAIDAGLLALVLWLYFPLRRRDGEVFALMLTLHPISRFFLEMIRSDEPGQFGTELTISQWLSLGLISAAAVLWWYVEHTPRSTGRGS